MSFRWPAIGLVTVGLVAAGLVVAGDAGGEEVSAGEGRRGRCLIVAGDPGDAECLRRIGGALVDVQRLFGSESGAAPADYTACNRRVVRLREFRLLMVRSETCCPSERFWQARLTAANPAGRVVWLAPPRCGDGNAVESRVERAIAVHRALVSILPTHRAELGENLRIELLRQRRLVGGPLQFASSNGPQ